MVKYRHFGQEGPIKRYIIYPVIISLLVCSISIDARAFQDRENTNLMHNLLRALANAFMMTLQEEQIEQPDTYEQIAEAVRSLTENAEQLNTHGRNQGQRFDFLQQAMARNAYDAENQFFSGQYEDAQYSLQELTESCFSCHMRLPGSRQNDFGKQFSKALNMKTLPLEERAKLEVITRQFDAALTTYETLIDRFPWDDPAFTFTETFENYLKVALRVRHEATRPLAMLHAVQGRSDIPSSLAEPIGDWIEGLNIIQTRSVENDTLAYARTLIQDAQLRRLFPDDRHGLVQLITASSILHQFIQAKPVPTDGVAEAYFLLAVTESHISTTSWISETEFFLETAIRLDPGAAFAPRAYAELETYILMTYGGLEEIDPDILDYLNELKALIEDTTGRPDN